VKTKSESDVRIEKALVENFIALQKVMTNLSVKFDNLSDQISKLLQLFEISAKALAEKDFEKFEKSDNKELLGKLDILLDQNKTIARGLTLIHEKNTRPPERVRNPQPQQPNPSFPRKEFRGYQPSGY
jgi:hypothetical protein